MLAYPTLLTQSYRNAILNSFGLVGYWRLAETSGTVGKDECGLANLTYTNAPTLGAAGAHSGSPGTSVNFVRASSTYASGTPAGGSNNDWTVMAWMNFVTLINFGCIVYWGTFTGSGWGIYGQGSGKLWVLAGAAGEITDSTTGSTIVVGQWYQVTVVRRSGTTYLYLNGVLDKVGNTIPPTTPSNNVQIGTDNGGGNFFDGRVAHVSKWTRPLELGEIANYYRLGRGF